MLNIEKLSRLSKEFAEEYSTSGLIGLGSSLMGNGTHRVHVTKESFFETFHEWESSQIEEEKPHYYTTVVDGVEFFCIDGY